MIRAAFLVLFTTGLCLWASAQELRTVNGEQYIVHTVAPGQTLFGVSKHYAVPLEAIMDANPGADKGLSIGQVLLVPTKGRSKKDLKNAPKLEDGGLVHKVAKKETLYGIARQYGVSQEDLRKWNPDLAYGLNPGMELRIQLAKSTAAPPVAVQPAVADSDEFHQVQPGETLYSLSKQFGIPPAELADANGGLPEGLKAGTYLRIPRSRPATKADTLATAPKPPPGVVRKVAVMLPFTALAKDTAAATDEEGRQASATEAAMEFRAGLGLALDTLRARGLNADVQVFDTGMRPAQWDPLFKSDAVRGMDLYIGPFHRAAVEALTRVSGNAPVICPVPQSSKVLLGHPTVSKAVCGRSDRMKLMARFIAFHHASDNVILLKPDIFRERDQVLMMQRQLQDQLNPRPAKLRDSLLVAPCGKREVEEAVKRLDRAHRNVLVVPSEDVEFVTAVLTKFSGLVPQYAITVYGMNGWMDMNTLDVAAMVKLDVRVPANGYIDRASPAVNDFTARYRAAYRNEPGEYAFLGYDVGLFFIGAEMQFGEAFPQHYAQVQAAPLYLNFRMEKLGQENGWANGSAVMLEYREEGIRKAE